MNYIDQICEKIVNPPKLRYSSYDLGIQDLIQGLLSLIMQKDMTSPSLISTDSKFKSASISLIKSTRMFLSFTCIPWMDRVSKVPFRLTEAYAMSRKS